MQPKAPILWLYVCLFSFLSFPACAAERNKPRQAQPANDIVLQKNKNAAQLLRRGEFVQAKAELDESIAYLTAVRTGTDDAKKAKSTFGKESAKFFLGEPYERVMAFYYRGIIYWMDGEPDNARACFRSGQIADADAEKKEYQADYVLLDYLDALASAKLQTDYNDAFVRSQTNAFNKFEAPPAIDNTYNVLVFIEFGNGPTKYATGHHKEELRFKEGSSASHSARLSLGSQSLTVRPFDDLSFQATTRGGRVMDHILANKVAFKDTANTVGDVAAVGTAVAAKTGNRDVALVGLGVSVFSKGIAAAAKPAADIRCWDNLPQYLSFAALKREPGANTVTVDFLDASGAKLSAHKKTIPLPPETQDKKETVLFVSDLQ